MNNLCEKHSNRQPIAFEVLDLGRILASKIEELSIYSKEKLMPISMKREAEPDKSKTINQEWPELFDTLRDIFDRIDRAAYEIRRNLDSAEI